MGEAQPGQVIPVLDQELVLLEGGDASARRNGNAALQANSAAEANRVWLPAVAVTAICFVALTAWGAAGLRGSDQYWYTAEIQHLLDGQINKGLVAFPFHAYNNIIPPPFNHHSLIHYIVLPFAQAFGPYYGWIVCNALVSLLAAVFVGLSARALGGSFAGALGFSMALIMPMVFWTTSQPYMESCLAFFLACGLYFYIVPRNSTAKWWKLLLVFSAAYLCRVSFLAILVMVPIGYVFHSRPFTKKKLAIAAAMFVVIALVLTGYKAVFKPDPAMTLTRYLNSNIPGISHNMHVLYSLDEERVELWKVVRKSVYGMWHQFFPKQLAVQVFYIPFNIMLLCTLIAAFSSLRGRYPTSWGKLLAFKGEPKPGRDVRLFVASIAVLAMHVSTICLRGNEFRFLHIVNPLVVLGFAVFVSRLQFVAKRKNGVKILAAAIIGMAGLDAMAAAKMRAEVARDQRNREELEELFQVAEPNDTVVFGIHRFSEKNLLAGYAVRPRMVLFMNSSYDYSDEQMTTMLRNVDAKWLFAHQSSPLIGRIAAGDQPVAKTFQKPFVKYGIYPIDRSGFAPGEIVAGENATGKSAPGESEAGEVFATEIAADQIADSGPAGDAL